MSILQKTGEMVETARDAGRIGLGSMAMTLFLFGMLTIGIRKNFDLAYLPLIFGGIGLVGSGRAWTSGNRKIAIAFGGLSGILILAGLTMP